MSIEYTKLTTDTGFAEYMKQSLDTQLPLLYKCAKKEGVASLNPAKQRKLFAGYKDYLKKAKITAFPKKPNLWSKAKQKLKQIAAAVKQFPLLSNTTEEQQLSKFLNNNKSFKLIKEQNTSKGKLYTFTAPSGFTYKMTQLELMLSNQPDLLDCVDQLAEYNQKVLEAVNPIHIDPDKRKEFFHYVSGDANHNPKDNWQVKKAFKSGGEDYVVLENNEHRNAVTKKQLYQSEKEFSDLENKPYEMTAGFMDGLTLGAGQTTLNASFNPFAVASFMAAPVRSVKQIIAEREQAKKQGDEYALSQIDGTNIALSLLAIKGGAKFLAERPLVPEVNPELIESAERNIETAKTEPIAEKVATLDSVIERRLQAQQTAKSHSTFTSDVIGLRTPADPVERLRGQRPNVTTDETGLGQNKIAAYSDGKTPKTKTTTREIVPLAPEYIISSLSKIEEQIPELLKILEDATLLLKTLKDPTILKVELKLKHKMLDEKLSYITKELRDLLTEITRSAKIQEGVKLRNRIDSLLEDLETTYKELKKSEFQVELPKFIYRIKVFSSTLKSIIKLVSEKPIPFEIEAPPALPRVFEPSPASSWLLKHPGKFKPTPVVLEPFEIELLQKIFDTLEVEKALPKNKAEFIQLTSGIFEGENTDIIITQLNRVMRKFKLTGVNYKRRFEALKKAYKHYKSTGQFCIIPPKPVMYEALEYLEKEGADKFLGLTKDEVANKIASNTETAPFATVRIVLVNLSDIFRTDNLTEIIEDWKIFKSTGKIPSRFLAIQMPLSAIQLELLRLLRQNPERYAKLFETNQKAMVKLLPKMQTSKNLGSINNELRDIRNRFNVTALDELLARAEELNTKGEVDLGKLTKQMPLTRSQLELLESLEQNPQEYADLFKTNHKALAEKLLPQMKTTRSLGSIQFTLRGLKDRFNAKILDELLAKAEELNTKGEVDLGKLTKQMPLGTIQLELLELLERNPGEYAELFKTHHKALAEKLLTQMRTSESLSSVRRVLWDLRNKFNVMTLDELLAKAEELNTKGEVDLGKLTKQMPLGTIQLELLELLERNPQECVELFRSNQIKVIARKLRHQMKSTESIHSIRKELANLRDRLNAATLDELLAKAEELKTKGEVNLGKLTKQMPLRPIQLELLELLEQNPQEYAELFKTNQKILAEKLTPEMKTTNSWQSVIFELLNLPKIFRLKEKRNLFELIEKYKELKEKGRIFGFLAPDELASC